MFCSFWVSWDQPVLHQVVVVVGAVFRPLLLDGLGVPGGVGAAGGFGRFAPGEVETAVLVRAGAQLPLRLGQLRRRQHGHAEAVGDVAAEDRLGSDAPEEGQQAGPGQLTAASGRGAGQTAKGVGTDETGALAPVQQAAACEGRPLAVGDGAAGTVHIAVEGGLHRLGELGFGGGRRQRQRVEKAALPVILRGGKAQHPAAPGPAQGGQGAGLGGGRAV